MNYTFIHYPKCTTCQRAKKFLDENKIKYTERHIITETPSYEELKTAIEQYIKYYNEKIDFMIFLW